MRSSKRLAAMTVGLIVGGLWVSGCGDDDDNFNGTVLLPTATVSTSTTSSNSNSTTSSNTSQAATTGTIVYNTTLAASRVISNQTSVPAAVTQFRFTGYDAGYNTVFGPKIANKAAQVSLAGVPTTIRHLLVELLQNGVPVGAVSVDVTVGAGATTTLNQSQYAYTVITGDDQEVISGSVSDSNGLGTINTFTPVFGNGATASPFVYQGQFLTLPQTDLVNGVTVSSASPATSGSPSSGTALVVQTPGTYLVSEIVEDSVNGNRSDLWGVVVNQTQGNVAVPSNIATSSSPASPSEAVAIGRTNSSSSAVRYLYANDRVQLELYRADTNFSNQFGGASGLTRANLQLQLLTPAPSATTNTQQ